jgi:hypothetical protein
MAAEKTGVMAKRGAMPPGPERQDPRKLRGKWASDVAADTGLVKRLVCRALGTSIVASPAFCTASPASTVLGTTRNVESVTLPIAESPQ